MKYSEFSPLIDNIRAIQHRFSDVTWVQHGGHHWLRLCKKDAQKRYMGQLAQIELDDSFRDLNAYEAVRFAEFWLLLVRP